MRHNHLYLLYSSTWHSKYYHPQAPYLEVLAALRHLAVFEVL